MFARALGVFASVSFLVACGSQSAAPRQPGIHLVVRAQARANDEGPPTWRLLDEAPSARRIPLPNGHTGVFVGGLRAELDARGTLLATADTELAVTLTAVVPAHLGGGFLFGAHGGVWHAPSFTGPLRLLESASTRAITVGPRGALVIAEDGRRIAIELPTGRSVRPSPATAISFAASDDGKRALALLEAGRLAQSSDGGMTWTDATAALGGAGPKRVHTHAGEPLVELETGAHLSFDGARLVKAPAPPTPRLVFDPRWRSSQSPIEAVVRRGAPTGDGRAAVIERGGLFEISLRTGSVEHVEAGVVPTDLSCVPDALDGGLLVLCQGSSRSMVLWRKAGAARLGVERTFPQRGTFFRGDGDSLLFDGPCAGTKRVEGQACLRTAKGWVDLDVSKLFSDARSDAPTRVVTWVPTDDDAVAVTMGTHAGFVSGRSSQRTAVEPAVAQRIAGLIGFPSGVMVKRLRLAEDGAIEGYGQNAPVRIQRDGTDAPAPVFSLHASIVSAPFALVRGQEGGLWQSNDWGRTFREVGGPHPAVKDSPSSCSLVGCTLGTWARVGWPHDAPTDLADAPRAPSIPEPLAAPVPSLRCTVAGPAQRAAATPTENARRGLGAEVVRDTPQSFLALFNRAAPHAQHSVVEAAAMRAGITGPAVDPNRAPTGRELRRVRWIEPFDPGATMQTATFTLGELADAARLTGSELPDPFATEQRGVAIPVLGGGLVLDDDASTPHLWLQKGAVVPIGLGSEDSSFATSSAALLGPNELALLLHDHEGRALVRRVTRGSVEPLFSIPGVAGPITFATNDAVGITPAGAPVIVRLPTVAPPTVDQPAWLLAPGAPAEALAPWSTVEADGSPACASMQGVRVIVAARRSWVRAGTADPTEERPFFARVRWSKERVCLEAVETHANGVTVGEDVLDSQVIGRFGKEEGFGTVLLAEGAELREPRTCTLAPPAR